MKIRGQAIYDCPGHRASFIRMRSSFTGSVIHLLCGVGGVGWGEGYEFNSR